MKNNNNNRNNNNNDGNNNRNNNGNSKENNIKKYGYSKKEKIITAISVDKKVDDIIKNAVDGVSLSTNEVVKSAVKSAVIKRLVAGLTAGKSTTRFKLMGVDVFMDVESSDSALEITTGNKLVGYSKKSKISIDLKTTDRKIARDVTLELLKSDFAADLLISNEFNIDISESYDSINVDFNYKGKNMAMKFDKLNYRIIVEDEWYEETIQDPKLTSGLKLNFEANFDSLIIK